MKKPEKVNLLKDVFENETSILQVVKSVDKEDRRGLQRRLHNILFCINAKNKRNKASVDDIAKWLVALYDIFFNAIKIRRVPLRNPPAAMSAILDTMKKVDNQVKRDVFNDSKYEKNGRVQLTTAQEMKGFDKNLVPDDPDVCCPYYEHKGTLNFVEGSDRIIEKNRIKVTEFREKKRKWDLHQQNRKNPPPLKKDGTPYTTIPLRPTLEKQIVKCCCSKFWCSNGVAMDDGFIRRFCPIGCKKEDGTLYPVNEDGLCTCPLCCCDCSLAHPYGLEAQIRTTEKLKPQGKSDFNSQVQRDRELFNTMKDIMSTSDQMATSSTESTIQTMKNDPEKFQINRSMVEYTDNIFYDSKAKNAMSKLQGINPEKLFGIGKFLSNKNNCPVPGGSIDTRGINKAKNQEHNNRLNSMESGKTGEQIDQETTPLMQSKLQPSFNKVTNDFLVANKKFTPAARAVDKVKGSREKKRTEQQIKLAEMLEQEKKGENKEVRRNFL